MTRQWSDQACEHGANDHPHLAKLITGAASCRRCSSWTPRRGAVDDRIAPGPHRSYGSFTRSFALPESVELDKIRSDLNDGELTLFVPKKPGSSPQRRKIQIGSGAKS